MAEKRKGGQPSKFNQEDADTICEALAEGHSLLSICEAMGIPYSTAAQWEADHPEHGVKSTHARALGCHVMAMQCLTIADNDTRDWEPVKDADGQVIGIRVDGEHVQRSKLRIETRMRLIGKWLPKVYGDKLALGGADDLPPIKSMPDDALLARIEALKARLDGKPG